LIENRKGLRYRREENNKVNAIKIFFENVKFVKSAEDNVQ